jgi:long-chain acyl-CoA synthetase
MAHPMVEACCLMGAGMPRPFAVLLLSEEARKQSQETAMRASIEASLRDLMDAINAQLDQHEQVSFMAVVYGPWTVGNDAMTPTLKIKRGVLENRYQGFVDDWNRQSRPIVWEMTN